MSTDPDPATLRIVRETEGYYELQLYEEALERAEKLRGHPDVSTFARSMRAECLRCLERYEEGASAFEELITSEPANVAAWVGLGWCLKRSGRLDLARRAMERMLDANPGEPIGLFNLACYFALLAERTRALELLRRAIGADKRFRTLARTEGDFGSLRGDPEFDGLIGPE